jgi:hypothetical protein
MQVIYSNDKVLSSRGDLIRAKRSEDGDVVLYIGAIAEDYDDLSVGIKEYLKCFQRELKLQTLYVHRPLLNADNVIAWAKANGFETTLLPSDMHVTVAFSKVKVDWSKVSPRQDEVVVNGGQRQLDVFGIDDKKATVLRFESPELIERWKEFNAAGASWDWPDYKPHVTISYNGIDNSEFEEAYGGELRFGPEIFAPVNEDWER